MLHRFMEETKLFSRGASDYLSLQTLPILQFICLLFTAVLIVHIQKIQIHTYLLLLILHTHVYHFHQVILDVVSRKEKMHMRIKVFYLQVIDDKFTNRKIAIASSPV